MLNCVGQDKNVKEFPVEKGGIVVWFLREYDILKFISRLGGT